MSSLFFFEDPVFLALCGAVALLAGFVKGVVGFAMPMILISGLSSVISPELALAGLIVPTLATNGIQALRQGRKAAVQSMIRFRAFLMIGFVMLVLSAQLVVALPVQAMLLAIGVLITLFVVLQLGGWSPKLEGGNNPRVELSIGAFAGFIGGLSGIWGPPTVAYLTAIGTEKREQMRVQGVVYGLGALALTFAHAASGIFNATTAVFSMALVPPAILGMWLGNKVQDRIDQTAFRKATLAVLLIAGLNLLRRGLMG